MKHLFTGVALAAVLAIAAPGWAQNPANQPAPNASDKAAEHSQPRATNEKATHEKAANEKAARPSTPDNGATAAARHDRPARHARMARHMQRQPRFVAHHQRVAMHKRHNVRHAWQRNYRQPWGYYNEGSIPSDHVANMLNREELGRVYSGSSMPHGGYHQGPGAYGPMGY